jgi:acyl carrier protein
MNQFLSEMAEILEVDVGSISMETRFRDIEGWGSMAGYSILITMEESYGTRIPVTEFLKLNTFSDLYSKIEK